MTLPQVSTSANFNPIARLYRWLEYLTFGSALARCRNHFLAQLTSRRAALVLGDGDGRFVARLLSANTSLHADVVDSSSAMLHLLTQRAHIAHTTAATRFRVHHVDALNYAPANEYDLIVTHFFLDCLTQPQLDVLVTRLVPHLVPGGLWLVSDFRIPAGALRLPAQALVCSLYLGFRLLTGLRTARLPDYSSRFAAAGLTCKLRHLSLGGILTTEIWAYTPAPFSA